MPNPIIIKPKRQKSKQEDLLDDKQIAYIQQVLDKSCNGEVCISRPQLFEELQDVLSLQIEQYQFERFITAAIRSDLIKGFETRSGRNGGICRKGVFTKRDASKKKRKRVKRSCTVTIQDSTFQVPVSETQILGFILTVLKAKPANDGKASIYINNGAYKLPSNIKPATILESFIVNVCKAQELDEEPILQVAES